MRTTSAAVAAFAMTFFFAAAGAFTLDGTWRVNGAIQDNPVTSTCVMSEKEGKLTGTCTDREGKPVVLTGTIKDKEIKWHYDTTYDGNAITVNYSAKLDKDDHMAGGIYVDPFGVDGTFTATKDKASAPGATPAPPASGTPPAM